jgi:DUF1009 family protein
MTKRKPTSAEKDDIEFGFKLAKEMAGLDIGQTICVKNKAVIAVEAMEGTDRCIRRAGEISKGNFVVVKVAKPKQDLRFDVPVVGLRTVEALVAARGAVLAVEAGKTLFFDREEFLKRADAAGLVVLGVKDL